jgi:hypothetical protein
MSLTFIETSVFTKRMKDQEELTKEQLKILAKLRGVK